MFFGRKEPVGTVFENARDRLARTAEQVKHLAGDGFHRMREQASHLFDQGKDYADHRVDDARGFFRSASGEADRQLSFLKDQAQDHVKKNPLLTIGVAIGVGLLIGLVLKGRDDRN